MTLPAHHRRPPQTSLIAHHNDPPPRSLQASSSSSHGLSWEELQTASQLARLSGLCYVSPEGLKARLESEGLNLVAQGRDKYTSW